MRPLGLAAIAGLTVALLGFDFWYFGGVSTENTRASLIRTRCEIRIALVAKLLDERSGNPIAVMIDKGEWLHSEGPHYFADQKQASRSHERREGIEWSEPLSLCPQFGSLLSARGIPYTAAAYPNRRFGKRGSTAPQLPKVAIWLWNADVDSSAETATLSYSIIENNGSPTDVIAVLKRDQSGAWNVVEMLDSNSQDNSSVSNH